MITIINKDTHAVLWNSEFTENWMGSDWVVVPENLEAVAKSCCGFCELTFNDAGELIDIIPTEKPELPNPEPTQLDIIEAQVTYTAMMTDTLLESEG